MYLIDFARFSSEPAPRKVKLLFFWFLFSNWLVMLLRLVTLSMLFSQPLRSPVYIDSLRLSSALRISTRSRIPRSRIRPARRFILVMCRGNSIQRETSGFKWYQHWLEWTEADLTDPRLTVTEPVHFTSFKSTPTGRLHADIDSYERIKPHYYLTSLKSIAQDQSLFNLLCFNTESRSIVSVQSR